MFVSFMFCFIQSQKYLMADEVVESDGWLAKARAKAYASQGNPSAMAKISIATWNVCGAHPNILTRIDHIIKLCVSERVKCDVICLQEIPYDSVPRIIDRFYSKDYSVAHSISPERPIGELVAFKGCAYKMFEYVPFVDQFDDSFGMSIVHLEKDGLPFIVVTGQLDPTSSDIRSRQFDDMLTLFKRSGQAIIVAFDTNMTDAEDQPWLPDGWADVWEKRGCPNEMRWSFDYKRNPMVSFGQQERLDRVVYYDGDRAKSLVPKGFGFLGTAPFGKTGATMASDHFGVWVLFQLEQKTWI